MSYDVNFYYVADASDRTAEARRLYFDHTEREPYPKEQSRRQRVVDELLAFHPTLKCEPDDRGFAYGCSVWSEDDECEMMPVDFGVDKAFVSFSYSADPEFIFELLNRIIAVFERHGYAAFDGQVDDVITADGSLVQSAGEFTRTFHTVVSHIEGMGETIIPPVRTHRKAKPWWKFW